jgi:hypothetical protein
MEVDERSDETVYADHASELVRFATGLVGIDDAPARSGVGQLAVAGSS